MRMSRSARFIPLLLALTTAAVLRAQNAPEATATAPMTERPAPPKRARAISGDVAASLAAGMPKYSPPPKPVEKPPEEDLPDLREVDKPKNTIIRLPKYVVRDAKPPVFRERDLHSESAQADIGMKRYAGLGLLPFSSLNRGVALFMYQEQERLDTIADLKDTAATARRAGDKGASDYLLRETDKTYMRTGDFGHTTSK